MKSRELERIWQEYERAIHSFLRSKVANEDDIEDLKQEVLFKTYQNLASLKQVINIKSWLFQIASNTVIDFYRKRARILRDQELNPDDLWFNEQEPEIKTELSKCVAPFIYALPEQYSSLLMAVELEGVNQKELAENYGISYSTLKSRVQKSRVELKKIFEDCCAFSFDNQGRLTSCSQKQKGNSKC